MIKTEPSPLGTDKAIKLFLSIVLCFKSNEALECEHIPNSLKPRHIEAI